MGDNIYRTLSWSIISHADHELSSSLSQALSFPSISAVRSSSLDRPFLSQTCSNYGTNTHDSAKNSALSLHTQETI